MLIAHNHAPTSIKISSDGDGDEWLAAVKLVSSLGVNMFTVENCARLMADTDKSNLVK